MFPLCVFAQQMLQGYHFDLESYNSQCASGLFSSCLWPSHVFHFLDTFISPSVSFSIYLSFLLTHALFLALILGLLLSLSLPLPRSLLHSGADVLSLSLSAPIFGVNSSQCAPINMAWRIYCTELKLHHACRRTAEWEVALFWLMHMHSWEGRRKSGSCEHNHGDVQTESDYLFHCMFCMYGNTGDSARWRFFF